MKNKKNRIYIISTVILLLISFQLTSCGLIEGINGILKGFQFSEPESKEIILSDETTPVDDSSKNDDIETDAYSETMTNSDSPGAKPYSITPTDKKGMENKVETEHYIFYFNNVNEEFLNIYAKIAEDGNKGIKIIFGEDLDKKIEIFLCENLEEFEMAADGISPPGFDGSEPVGQSVNGAIHMYRAEEFKPGPGGIDEMLSYKIALLHEIGHTYYFWVYPNAAKKNDWLNEALADKSITGEYVDPYSISNDFLKDLISNGNFVALSELESNGRRTFDQDGNTIFSEYISFVNFISLQFGFSILNLLLAEYDGSDDLLTSLETATELDSGSFEEQWLDAIRYPSAF